MADPSGTSGSGAARPSPFLRWTFWILFSLVAFACFYVPLHRQHLFHLGDPPVAEPIDPQIRVAMSESCMDGSYSFEMILWRDGRLTLSPLCGTPETRPVDAGLRERVVDAFFAHDVPGMQLTYIDVERTCGTGVRLVLNDRGVRKTVLANSGDPDARPVFDLIRDVDLLLGIEAWLEKRREAFRRDHPEAFRQGLDSNDTRR